MEEEVYVIDGSRAERRLAACRGCVLYGEDHGVCRSDLWVRPGTGEVSHRRRGGYVNGCGCVMERKVRKAGAGCPLGRWVE